MLQNFLISNSIGIISNLFSTVTILGLVYYIFWVLGSKKFAKRKIQLSKRAGWTQIKGELVNTFFTIIANAFFAGIVLWLVDNGYSKFYTETGKYGLWYEVFSFLVIFFIADAWFYWAHRVLHHPKIYKYIHAIHHKSLDTNPFTSYSFHILEGILLTLWILPTALLFPASILSLTINQVLGLFNNIKSHLGYEFYPKFFAKVFPFNMLVTSTNHNIHHARYNGNYGLQLRFWDILCKTEIADTQDIFVDIHNRKQVTIIDNTKYQTVQISKLVKETKDAVSIYFKPNNPNFYKYLPGQYINLRIKINNQVHERCFSLSSSPLDDYLRITVKLNGLVSHYFNYRAKVGYTFEVLKPDGDFGLKTDIKNVKNYLMIAGGSGITPIYSMIKTILQIEPNSKISLLYANKTESEIIFASEIENLTQKYINFKVENFLSDKNRLGIGDIEKYTQYKNFECYYCGPESLKIALKNYFIQLNLDNEIKTEDFADGYKSIWSEILKKHSKI